MEFFPDLSIFLRIGSFEIHWYSLTMWIGISLGYVLIGRKLKKTTGYSDSFFDDFYFTCILIGIAGARLWYVIFHPQNYMYFNDPISILKVWEGGLAMQGMVVGVAIYILVLCYIKKIDALRLFDLCMPVALISQAIGRWGNFFNQEAYGTIVSESFYKYFPSFIKEGMFIYGEYRMPMFLIESVLNTIGFILIYTLIKKYLIKKRGDYAYWYLMWTGVVRLFVEHFRTDSLMMGSFKSAQVVSIVYIVIAILGLSGIIDKLYKKAKPLILFDLDGTLVDSRQIITDTFNELFKKYKIYKTLTVEESDEVFGPPLADNLIRFFPDYDFTEVYNQYRVTNELLQKKNLKPIDNAKELLKFLKQEGYDIAVISNKTNEAIKFSLKQCDMLEYVNTFVGIDDVEKPKPDKESIIKVAECLKRGIDELIMIGDSVDDVICGQNGGAFSIAFNSFLKRKEQLLATNPNRYIEDLIELKEILKEKHSWTKDLM